MVVMTGVQEEVRGRSIKSEKVCTKGGDGMGGGVTHNLTQPLSDITGRHLSDYMQLLPEPQKALYYFICSCSRAPQHP